MSAWPCSVAECTTPTLIFNGDCASCEGHYCANHLEDQNHRVCLDNVNYEFQCKDRKVRNYSSLGLIYRSPASWPVSTWDRSLLKPKLCELVSAAFDPSRVTP